MSIRRGLVAFGTSIALIGTACGGGGSSLNVEDEPKEAVVEAFGNMAEWGGSSMTLRLDTTSDSLLAMDDAGEMTPDLAQALADSFVRIQATSGDDVEDSSDDEFALLVHIEDLDAIEVRSLDEQLYLRAAVRDLVTRFDTSGTALADLDTMISQAEAAGLGFLDAAADGAWLQLEGYEQLGSMFGGMSGQSEPDPEEAEAMTAEIAAIFQAFVEQDVTVTYIGEDDAGEHVRLVASGENLIDLLEEVLGVAGALATGVPGADPSTMLDELRSEAGEDLAAFTMPLDVWIDGDSIGRIGIDLLAMFEANREALEAEGEEIPEGVERLAIHVDLEEFTGGVSAPDDATSVDLFSIFGQFMSQMGGELDAAA